MLNNKPKQENNSDEVYLTQKELAERLRVTKSTSKYNTEILTIQEVADLLRVHRSTITRLAKSGELKSHQIGSRRLFKRDDVYTFFDNQESPEYVSRRNHYGNS